MNEQVARDLSRSANVFTNKIVPILEQIYKNSRYICLETINQEFAKDFDIRAGIDAWQIIDDKIRGIGSRIQHGTPSDKYPYDTFTIRLFRDSGRKTEYEKRKEVINSNEGWIYPYFTLHAYTDEDDNLLQFALAETTDLIDIINNKEHKERRTKNATFGYIEWSKDLCIFTYKNGRIIHGNITIGFFVGNKILNVSKTKELSSFVQQKNDNIVEARDRILSVYGINCSFSEICKLRDSQNFL